MRTQPNVKPKKKIVRKVQFPRHHNKCDSLCFDESHLFIRKWIIRVPPPELMFSKRMPVVHPTGNVDRRWRSPRIPGLQLDGFMFISLGLWVSWGRR